VGATAAPNVTGQPGQGLPAALDDLQFSLPRAVAELTQFASISADPGHSGGPDQVKADFRGLEWWLPICQVRQGDSRWQ
jgi:hypothetical protein